MSRTELRCTTIHNARPEYPDRKPVARTQPVRDRLIPGAEDMRLPLRLSRLTRPPAEARSADRMSAWGDAAHFRQTQFGLITLP